MQCTHKYSNGLFSEGAGCTSGSPPHNTDISGECKSCSIDVTHLPFIPLQNNLQLQKTPINPKGV